MRMVMLADLHLGIGEDNTLWHKASLDLASEVHDCAVKHDIDTVCVLGDIFDNRRSISQKTADVALDIVSDIWGELNTILIRGNHDTYFKDRAEPNWLKMFQDCDNAVIVTTEPYNIGKNCFIPWAYDISTLPEGTTLFCHAEINDFRMNNSYKCNTSHLNTINFKKFKRVFSGHFHCPQSYENITYLGSPFQQNFGDVGSTRGYYILDGEDLEFIEFTKAPRFVIIKANEQLTADRIKGNIVKLVFDKDYGTRKNNIIIEDVEMLEPAALVGVDTSNFSTDEVKDVDTEIVIKDNIEMLKEYIELSEFPEHLKKKTMMTMLDMLIKELESD